MKPLKYILFSIALICAINASAQYSATTVTTPNATSVPALSFTGTDYSTSDKNALRAYWEGVYGGRIIFESEATYRYNCHAWAWAGSTSVWINAPNERNYWLDRSYIGGLSNPSTGTKMWYGVADDHSANVLGSNRFSSKWGSSPRFNHTINDSPYITSSVGLYKRYSPPNYYVSTVRDEWGGYSTIYTNSSGFASVRLELFVRVSSLVTPTSYVWTATWDGSSATWNLSPTNSSVSYADVNIGSGSGGSLRIVCAVYNGGTLLGSSLYYLNVSP